MYFCERACTHCLLMVCIDLKKLIRSKEGCFFYYDEVVQDSKQTHATPPPPRGRPWALLRRADRRGLPLPQRSGGTSARRSAARPASAGKHSRVPVTSVRCERGWVCFSYHLFHWPFNSVFAAQPGRPLWISQTCILHSPFCQPYFK